MDMDSSLPVRTQENGDVVIRIADGLVPSQLQTVNADGSINITDNAGSITIDTDNGPIQVEAADLDIRDLVFATDKVDVSGSQVSLDEATLAALEDITVSATDLDIRDLAFATDKVDVTGSDVTATVTATDLDIRDISHVSDSIKVGDGTDFLAVNTDGSINVVVQEDVGTEVVDYDTTASVAGGATDNHDRVFASASKLYQVLSSASGKLKIEVLIETGAGTNVFNPVCVRFNSTANPDCDMTLAKYAPIPAGARVRVIRTNRDVAPQDVYSTIVAILG